MSNPPVLSVRHSAPGPYLGFAIQPVRLCYYLLSSPLDAFVSTEFLDDVAVHYADGTYLLEQCKSALSHNALSDWSMDLWKTIGNWVQIIQSNRLGESQCAFQLYVTPPKTGAISSAIHAALTPETVESVTKLVHDKLRKKANPPECLSLVQSFLDASHDVRSTLVAQTTIVSNDTDPLDPIRALLEPTISARSINIICESAIGMAKEAADRCIRQGKPAIISVSEFRKSFHAFVQTNNMPGYLPTFSHTPTDDAAKHILFGRPTFVRQLELIEASEDLQVRAVSDFLRTSADKAVWAEQGLVFEGSFSDWETTLIRNHSAIQGEVNDLFLEHSEQMRGRVIYNRCSTLDVPIDSRAVPGHFTNGGFNDLADRRMLGWHPQYQALLDKDDDQ